MVFINAWPGLSFSIFHPEGLLWHLRLARNYWEVMMAHRRLQLAILAVAGLFLVVAGLFFRNQNALMHPSVIYVESHDPGSQMIKYMKQGRYDDAIQTGLQWHQNNPDDQFMYQQVANVYLIRAQKDPDHREQWVGQAVFYTDKAVSPPYSKEKNVAGVDLFQAGRSFELAGDLSTSARCAYYERARKFLEDRALSLQGDQVQAGGKTFPLAPLRNENEKFLAEVKTKSASLGCK